MSIFDNGKLSINLILGSFTRIKSPVFDNNFKMNTFYKELTMGDFSRILFQ